MSLCQHKETTALHVVSWFGPEYPTQELLAALRHQTKVSYFDQKLIELANISPLKVLGLTNKHLRTLFQKAPSHLCSLSPLPVNLQ